MGDERPLQGLQHAVCGIGSTCYETFQNCPRHVDKYLGEAGSRRMKERFEWDEMEHVDNDVLAWADDVYKVMIEESKHASSKNKPDVCSWTEPKSELLPKIVGEDGYEIGNGRPNGFTARQIVVLVIGAIAAAAGYWYKQQQAAMLLQEDDSMTMSSSNPILSLLQHVRNIRS